MTRVVLDIEGTCSPLSAVRDQLFSYARAHYLTWVSDSSGTSDQAIEFARAEAVAQGMAAGTAAELAAVLTDWTQARRMIGEKTAVLDQMRQRPTQPVQPPHHQRVPRPQLIEQHRQLRAVGPSTAGGVRPDPPTPRGPQRVLLQRRGLLRGGHPRIAQKFAHDQALLHNPPTSLPVTHRFRTVLLQHPAGTATCTSVSAAGVLLKRFYERKRCAL